jgi:hypothetical protein
MRIVDRAGHNRVTRPEKIVPVFVREDHGVARQLNAAASG